MILIEERLALVRDLLELSKPMYEVMMELGKFSWDFEAEGICLTARHIHSVLERYLHGELSASTVEEWANNVEGRDDVSYEAKIAEVIYELANPYLTHVLSEQRARELIHSLDD